MSMYLYVNWSKNVSTRSKVVVMEAGRRKCVWCNLAPHFPGTLSLHRPRSDCGVSACVYQLQLASEYQSRPFSLLPPYRAALIVTVVVVWEVMLYVELVSKVSLQFSNCYSAKLWMVQSLVATPSAGSTEYATAILERTIKTE